MTTTTETAMDVVTRAIEIIEDHPRKGQREAFNLLRPIAEEVDAYRRASGEWDHKPGVVNCAPDWVEVAYFTLKSLASKRTNERSREACIEQLEKLGRSADYIRAKRNS